MEFLNPNETKTENSLSVMKYSKRKKEETLSKLKVLLVDDSPDNRFLFKSFLSRLGAQVELAENGQEAIEKAKNFAFDILLMDIQMPVMDGLEAMNRLCALKYPAPVIAMSGDSQTENIKKISKSGFAGYLVKPVDRQQMTEMILELKSDENKEPSRVKLPF